MPIINTILSDTARHNISNNAHENMGWITSKDAEKFVTIEENGKISSEKMPDNLVYFNSESGELVDVDGSEIGINGGGIVVSSTSPQKTNVLWIDSSNSNIPKFYNPSTSAWEPLASTWG